MLQVCVEVKITTGNNGNETSWRLEGSSRNGCSNNGTYRSYSQSKETCCLKKSSATLRCADSGHNGFEGGYISINGRKFCGDSSWADLITYRVETAGTKCYLK